MRSAICAALSWRPSLYIYSSLPLLLFFLHLHFELYVALVVPLHTSSTKRNGSLNDADRSKNVAAATAKDARWLPMFVTAIAKSAVRSIFKIVQIIWMPMVKVFGVHKRFDCNHLLLGNTLYCMFLYLFLNLFCLSKYHKFNTRVL